MKGYKLVLKMMVAVAAALALAPPGSAAERIQFYVPGAAPEAITLRFVAIDPARNAIDEHWLLEEITSTLQARSGWPLSSSGTTTTELSGLRARLDEDQSQIVFEYVHVDRNKVGDEWGETLTIPVPYRVEKMGVIYLVRLGPAQLANLETRKTPGVPFLPAPKLRPLVRVFDDFSAIMKGVDLLELHRAFLLSGQLETTRPPQSCIEKFDSELGRYAYAKDEARVFDPKHDNVFLFRTAQESVPLKIEAVDDRGGSRVFYEAWLPFELRADGTVKDYDLAAVVTTEVNQVLQDAPARQAWGASDDAHEDVKTHGRR